MSSTSFTKVKKPKKVNAKKPPVDKTKESLEEYSKSATHALNNYKTYVKENYHKIKEREQILKSTDVMKRLATGWNVQKHELASMANKKSRNIAKPS